MMVTFFKETLLLFYYAYFKPMALQVRLNQAAPQAAGSTGFWQLSFRIFDTPKARGFLGQCLVWWLLELLPLWIMWAVDWNDQKSWISLVYLSGSFLLAGWGLALFSFPLGLAFPILASVVWGFKPELWDVLQNSLVPWRNWVIVGLLAADLFLGMLIGGGGGVIATTMGQKKAASLWTGFITFIVGVVAGGVAVAIGMKDAIHGNIANMILGGVAVVVASIVASVMAVLVAMVVADEDDLSNVVGIVAVGVAVGVAGSAAVGIAGSVAVSVAGNVAGSVAVVVAGLVAVVVAVVVQGIVESMAGAIATSLTGGAAGMMAGGVAGVVAVTLTSGISTLPPPLALLVVFGLSFAFSPICSTRLGLILSIIVTLLFVEPQGWVIASIAWLVFLLGYFRVPLYPLALLELAILGGAGKRINRRLRLLPPFNDEIFWLPLYGLDSVLIAAVEENADKGQAAITHVEHVFRQAWAAQIAQIYLIAQNIKAYRTLHQVSDALDELEWLPDKPTDTVESAVKVGELMKKVVHNIQTALKISNETKRLAEFGKATKRIKTIQKFLDDLPEDNPALYFKPIVKQWGTLIRKQVSVKK